VLTPKADRKSVRLRLLMAVFNRRSQYGVRVHPKCFGELRKCQKDAFVPRVTHTTMYQGRRFSVVLVVCVWLRTGAELRGRERNSIEELVRFPWFRERSN